VYSAHTCVAEHVGTTIASFRASSSAAASEGICASDVITDPSAPLGVWGGDPSDNSAINWLGVQPGVEKAPATEPMTRGTERIQREQLFEIRI
jgi:hypothetical protein